MPLVVTVPLLVIVLSAPIALMPVADVPLVVMVPLLASVLRLPCSLVMAREVGPTVTIVPVLVSTLSLLSTATPALVAIPNELPVWVRMLPLLTSVLRCPLAAKPCPVVPVVVMLAPDAFVSTLSLPCANTAAAPHSK